jgi:predicted acyl esterase
MLAVVGALMAHGVPSAAAWTPRPATYGHVTVPNVPVAMDDGVELVGDVIYPTDPATGARAPGTFPVLLTQNPYTCHTSEGNIGAGSALGPSTSGTTYFVDRGYIFASVCVRGTGRSGGRWEFFGPREQRDGVALVDWAAHRLAGSNGVVGLTGCSYLGATQIFTAGALGRGSPVKAILPACWGAETYREPVFSGGMPTQSLNYFHASPAMIGPSPPTYGLDLAAEMRSGGERAYRRDWWKARDVAPWAEKVVANGIPAMLWTGWEDIFAQGALELYARFQNAAAGRPPDAPMLPGTPVTGRYQLVVGPWAHAAGIDQGIELRWFDTWLRGEKTQMADTANPMHLYQLGSATWINTSHYPMARQSTSYYLGAGGTLTASPPPDDGEDAIGSTQPDAPGGRLDYTTEPLRDGTTIAGPVSATLHAGSSGTNLQLIARLYDVAADGTSTRITAGSIVGSLRALDAARSWYDRRGIDIRPYGSYLTDAYLTPGASYELTFRLLPRVIRIAPGHRLRLSITTQTPAAECANLLGLDPCYPTDPQARTLPGTYRVLHSSRAPSAIHLPLLPTDCFKPDGGSGPQPASLGEGAPARAAGTPCASAPAPRPRAVRAPRRTAGLTGLPSASRCLRDRRLRFRVRATQGARLRLARIYVDGRQVRVLPGRRLRSRVVVVLPRRGGRVRLVAKTQAGRTLLQDRRYRICR